MKTAVVLLNLGGPDERRRVWRYLYCLFSDPAVFRLPPVLRQVFAFAFASLRAGKTRRLYARLGGSSPLLRHTQAQATALEKALGNSGKTKCCVAMRYGYPSVREAVTATEEWRADRVVFLPMYPQFSSVTTGSGWREFMRYRSAKVPVAFIRSYPDNEGFITSLARATAAAYREAEKHGAPRVLFSAHGLPEKIVRQGDPYAEECERTTRALVKTLNIPGLDWVLCYQSRAGPFRWTGPETTEEIAKAASAKRPIVIVPISFTAENVETLIEVAQDYREKALKAGAPCFICVSAVGAAPEFIEGLAALVRKAVFTTLPRGEDSWLTPEMTKT